MRLVRPHFWLAIAISLGAPTVARGAHAQRATDMRALARSVAVDYFGRGQAAEREGRLIAAESLYAQAVDADRSYIDGFLGLARMQLARGRARDGARTLESAAQSALVDDDSAARWARAMAQLGAVDDAIRSIESRAESPRSLRLVAELYVASARIPEALARARRAVELVVAAGGDPQTERDARRFARALSLLSGEADAVRSPGASASLLRRLLAR
jgi:tetratricopeptide (TPR) repeat protein